MGHFKKLWWEMRSNFARYTRTIFTFWGMFRFLKFFIIIIIYHSIFRQFWFIKLLTEIEKCIEKVSFGKLPPSYVEYYSHWTFNIRVDKSFSKWAIQTRNFNLIGSEITPVKTPSSVIYSKSSGITHIAVRDNVSGWPVRICSGHQLQTGICPIDLAF